MDYYANISKRLGKDLDEYMEEVRSRPIPDDITEDDPRMEGYRDKIITLLKGEEREWFIQREIQKVKEAQES